MRFIRASLTGTVVSVLGLAVLVWGVWSLSLALEAAGTVGPRVSVGERAVAVATAVIVHGEDFPQISTFGRVVSTRGITLASEPGGRAVHVAEAARAGMAVARGSTLLEVDALPQQSSLDRARALLAEAQADHRAASQAVDLAVAELETARAEHALRQTIEERQASLARRGVVPPSALDEAALAVLASGKALTLRTHGLRAAEIALPRAALAVDRARLAVEDAERALAQTVLRAPFDGVLVRFDAAEGDLLKPGEPFGRLIDPTALEVVFSVTEAQFDRLLGASGLPAGRRAWVLPDAGRSAPWRDEDESVPPRRLPATVVRAGAVVPEGRTGRELVARLDDPRPSLRPGDFVGIEIDEPVLHGVARVPGSAVTEDGRMLLVGPEDRLVEHRVRILRRDGDGLVIDGVGDGARYVLTRRRHLGTGVLVAPYDAGDAAVPVGDAAVSGTATGRG